VGENWIPVRKRAMVWVKRGLATGPASSASRELRALEWLMVSGGGLGGEWRKFLRISLGVCFDDVVAWASWPSV